jgi:divalent metal cation (Fe/Co/Zn/Cd) transporter
MKHLSDIETSILVCCDASQDQTSARQVIWLQVVTLAWMLIECGIALVAAWRAQSPLLLAFGADSVVELLSATVVLLQFVPAIALSKAWAARLAGILLIVLAGGVTVTSGVALIGGVEPGSSWLGIGVTIAALIAMPLLSGAKRRAARRLHNTALAADAVQSATCAFLAAITLFGLALNAAFSVPWIDPAAALVAVPIICLEGRRALRGEICGCC